MLPDWFQKPHYSSISTHGDLDQLDSVCSCHKDLFSELGIVSPRGTEFLFRLMQNRQQHHLLHSICWLQTQLHICRVAHMEEKDQALLQLSVLCFGRWASAAQRFFCTFWTLLHDRGWLKIMESISIVSVFSSLDLIVRVEWTHSNDTSLKSGS